MLSCEGKEQSGTSPSLCKHVLHRSPTQQDTIPCEFCTGKTRAGGTSAISFKQLFCRPQINRAVHEVNDLARKNKDSIEGLAEEVG